MYKIFFKDRVIFLTDHIDAALDRDFGAIHKLGSKGELKKFIENFEANEDRMEAFIYHHDKQELLKRFRECFENIPAAGGLVWNKNKDHILTIVRRGRHDLPKGKREVNETSENAAIREVNEECGIENAEILTELGSTFHTYRLKDAFILKETRWFEMIYRGSTSPIPQDEEDITLVKWLPVNEVEQLAKETYSSINEVIKKAGLI